MTLSPEAEAIFAKCAKASEEGLRKMRDAAHKLFGNDGRFLIGVNGSFARREVTGGSDVDLFFLTFDDDPTTIVSEQSRFNEELVRLGFKLPASGGVFKNPHSVNETRNTIGGLDDKNEFITRRMLFLLEGEWIFNQGGFASARETLLDRYIDDGRRTDQICLFLLNDIIRYWRTICVDYEFKIRDGAKAKAIRLIKLRFSRMMLYVAGVLAVSETFGKACGDKRSVLTAMLSLPPVERFRKIVGSDGDATLELYAQFLAALDAGAIREQLDLLSPEGEKTREFEALREKAQSFRNEIYGLLTNKLEGDNPTVRALML